MLGDAHGPRADNIVAGCDDSLRRLGVETIDLYLRTRTTADAAGRIPRRARRARRSRQGARGRRVELRGAALRRGAREQRAHGQRALRGAAARIQPRSTREIEERLMPLCGASTSSARAVLRARERISDRQVPQRRRQEQEPARRRDRQVSRRQGPRVLAALDAVAARHGATCAQVALAWIMAKPAIAAPIASATSVAQVTELMGALRLKLSAGDVAELDAASA